jgi:hypothetical protein
VNLSDANGHTVYETYTCSATTCTLVPGSSYDDGGCLVTCTHAGVGEHGGSASAIVAGSGAAALPMPSAIPAVPSYAVGPLSPTIPVAAAWIAWWGPDNMSRNNSHISAQAVYDNILAQEAAKGPPPNNGNAPAHGNPDHDEAIIEKAAEVEAAGATDIRKNQVQVDINGNRVGDNKPDLQYNLDGVHHNWEVDRAPARSLAHGEKIRANDPYAVCTLTMLGGC